MTETPAGGLDIIREAVFARRSAWVMMVRDCAVGIDLLDAFANGGADIPAENLDQIVKWILNDNVEYNFEADALQAVPQPPARPLGTPPELTMKLPVYQPGPNQRGGPTRETPAPKKPKRAGWEGGLE